MLIQPNDKPTTPPGKRTRPESLISGGTAGKRWRQSHAICSNTRFLITISMIVIRTGASAINGTCRSSTLFRLSAHVCVGVSSAFLLGLVTRPSLVVREYT